MASGNLGLISFPREPGRVTLEQIDERRPGLLDALRAHPGIAFVLVRSERNSARSCSARPGSALLRDDTRRGRRPARAVRPVRGRPRAPHRRLRALPRHRRQQHLLGGAGGGRGVRGARRLARRDGRRPGAPVRPAPGRPAVAGRRRSSAPRPCTASCAAGSRSSGRTAYADAEPSRSTATRRGRASPRASRAPARPCDARTSSGGSVSNSRGAARADREERPPVDRHRDPRLDERDRARRALGSRWPGPSDGPQPQIGISATSTAPRSARMPSSRSVSPANQTPSTRKPSVSCSSARAGRRRPSCQAGTARTSLADGRRVSPAATSRDRAEAHAVAAAARRRVGSDGRRLRRARAAAATACRGGRGAGARCSTASTAPGCAGVGAWRAGARRGRAAPGR